MSEAPAPYLPLTGIKVLDLSRLIVGGLATRQLADLGAEVVKVEDPTTGDYLRTVAPIQNAPAVQAKPAALQTPPNMADLGARVFAGECANCHAWDGTGVQTPQASLVGSRTVNDPAWA